MKTLLYIAIIFSSMSALGQDTVKSEKTKVKKGFGVSVTQVQPSFPGGEDSLQSFLKNNLTYPDSAKLKYIEGKVYIGFKVDRNGKIKNPRVLSSASTHLDQEAMRVVNMMPDWNPGTVGGSPVDVEYILPIDFITPPPSPKKN